MIEKLTFKEILLQDVKRVFLNPAEFGEVHNVGGKEMTIVIDDSELMEREKRMKNGGDGGVYVKQTVIYASALDFGAPPVIGDLLGIDEDMFVITDCISEGGIYSIHLEDYRS